MILPVGDNGWIPVGWPDMTNAEAEAGAQAHARTIDPWAAPFACNLQAPGAIRFARNLPWGPGTRVKASSVMLEA